MNIHKGSDRTAYVGERYTVKVARSNPVLFLQEANGIRDAHGLRNLLKVWNIVSVDSHGGLKYMLLHGVMANRRERRIAKEFGSVIVPTLSVLGLVNIQPSVPTTTLTHMEAHTAFCETLGPTVTKLGHMLEDTSNLGVHDGQVKFVDGGSVSLEGLMHSQAEDIEQALGALTLKLETPTQ